ncbi:MAG: hypothetical protein AAGB26_14895 [Planctomycetota bacterium]
MLVKACYFFFNIDVHCFHLLGKVGKLWSVSKDADLFAFQDSVCSASNGVLAIPARVIATSFALLCFAATIVVGLANENDWLSILSSAFLVCLVSWIVGSVLGMLILHSVNEQIDRHREDNPIPDEENIFESDPTQVGTG